MPETAPTLTTERLVLRAYSRGDFEAFAAMRADPEVMGFIAGGSMSREEAWGHFVRNIGLWRLLGFGYWAVTDGASGAYLGHVGFQENLRDLEPSIEGTLEAGWMMTASAQGRGIATEAMSAVLAWAEAAFPQRRVTCFIDRENARSLRIAAKLGFERLADSVYKTKPVVVFERPAPAR